MNISIVIAQEAPDKKPNVVHVSENSSAAEAAYEEARKNTDSHFVGLYVGCTPRLRYYPAQEKLSADLLDKEAKAAEKRATKALKEQGLKEIENLKEQLKVAEAKVSGVPVGTSKESKKK